MPLLPTDPKVKKSNSSLLSAARDEDNRHRLHAEPAMKPELASCHWKVAVEKEVNCTIPAPTKRAQILANVAWPLVSVELVDEIQDACGAVHTAQDRNIRVELTDEKLQADYEQYIQDSKLLEFITSDCTNALFSSPNSLVVVDVAAVQTTPFPEPYAYLLDLSKVIAVEVSTSAKNRGQVEWVWFETDLKDENNKPIRALFDSDAYTLYQRGVNGEWIQRFQAFHGLGYCPVFKMWSDLDSQNPLISNTILRPLLGKLDRYPFDDANKQLLDKFGANPMLWHFETDDCSYHLFHEEVKISCDGGWLITPAGNVRCPKCAERSTYAPGTKIPIPAQGMKDDPDFREPAGWIKVDIDALNYARDKVTLAKAEIKAVATGIDGDLLRNEAVNQDQVMAVVEKGRNVLSYLAGYFEILTARVLDTVGRLRYGPSFIGSEVSNGRRFTMLSGDQLMELQKAAKNAGAPDWQLEEIDGLLQDYFARSDAGRRLRFRMLTDLNPYPFKSTADLIAANIALADPVGYQLSVGLLGYVHRFERENLTPIERWQPNKDYNFRLSEILLSLTSYVEEQRKQLPDPGANDPNNPGGGSTGGQKPA